jgi:hypothetical protein
MGMSRCSCDVNKEAAPVTTCTDEQLLRSPLVDLVV